MNNPKEEALQKAFNVFKIKDGFITAKKFRHIMTNLGNKLSHSEVDLMIQEVGVNEEGNIDYNELIRIILSK